MFQVTENYRRSQVETPKSLLSLINKYKQVFFVLCGKKNFCQYSTVKTNAPSCISKPALILSLRPANGGWCYFVTRALICWVQAWNQPWKLLIWRGNKISQMYIHWSICIFKETFNTNVVRVIDDWLEPINDNSLTGACLLNVSKCFDSINHEINKTVRNVRDSWKRISLVFMLPKKLSINGVFSTRVFWI